MFEVLWHRLDDKELSAKIKGRIELFLGARGHEALQAMVIGGINSMIQSAGMIRLAELEVTLLGGQVRLELAIDEEDDFSSWGEERNIISFTSLAIIRNLSDFFSISIQTADKYISKSYGKDDYFEETEEERHSDRQCISVVFTPDLRLFGFKTLPYYVYHDYCRQQAMLNSGLKIILKDDSFGITSQQNLFQFEHGLEAYLKSKDDFLSRRGNVAHFHAKYDSLEIEIAVSRNDHARLADSYANNERTFAGGTHFEGCLEGAVTAINHFLEEQNNVGYYDAEQFCSRFDFVVSVHLPVPKYFGVARQKLRNPDVFTDVKAFMEKEFLIHLRRFPLWYRG